MYAVIESGGKQYRVELGTELAVDRLDAQPGQSIEFERVLLVADGDQAAIGRPTVDGARVTADVVRQDRGDKIVVFKYRPKARSRVKQGHRADLTVLRVADIELGRKSARKLAADARTERERLEAAAAEAAAKQAEADKALAAKLAKEAAAAEASAPAKAGATKPRSSAKTEPKPTAKATTAAKPKSSAKTEPKSSAKTEPKSTSAAKPKSAASRTQAPQPTTKPPRATKKKDE
jgi:large subunit ribosomal protein L21